MGKGRAKRRRERNAARAATEKRHGMGILPDASDAIDKKQKKRRKGQLPADEAELDGLPRHMRQMIKLKAFADKQAKAARAEEARRQAAAAAAAAEAEAGDNDDQEEGARSSGAVEAQPAGGSVPGDATAAAKGAEAAAVQPEEAPAKRPRHREDLTGVDHAQKELSAKAAERSRRKERAKEWKKQKRLKQKERDSRVRVPGDNGDSADEAPAQREKVRFGETVAQPPEFNLKQRHWDPQQQAERCKGIFQRQLAQAAASARGGAKPLPDVGAMDAEDATLRLTLIENYRQQRRGGGGRPGMSEPSSKARRGPATLQSLKKLVAASSGEAPPAQG